MKDGAKWRQCKSKERYATEHEANHVITKCYEKRPDTRLRVYDCAVCEGWHITSKAETKGP